MQRTGGPERGRVHRYALAYLTAFLIVGSMVAVYSIPSITERARTSYNLHSPISIDGDADLLSQAASEPWSGTGSLGDPILIRDYEIDASSTGTGIAILNTSLHVVVDACKIYNGYLDGIYLQNVTNATITSCIISDCSEGIYSYNVSDAKLVNCTFPFNSDTGIWFEASDNITVEACNATGNLFCGLYVDSSEWMRIANSTFNDDGTEGVWIYGSQWLMLTNCTASGTSGGDGAYIEYSKFFMLEGNNLSQNYNGVYVYYCENFSLGNNTMSSNGAQGLTLDNCLDFGARYNICENENIGISIYQANGTVEGNKVSDCNYGIFSQYSNWLRLVENNCSFNSVGICVQYSNNDEIVNNTCTWCFSAGMYLDTVNDARIMNNNCSNGTSILLLVFSNNNEITYNVCSGNSGVGMDLEWSNYNTLMYNDCDRNSDGIYLSGSVGNTIMYSTCEDNSDCGIELSFGSDGNVVSSNTLDLNSRGVLVSSSRDLVLEHNSLTSNPQGGIAIESSLNVTLGWNNFVHDGVWLFGTASGQWNSHSINKTNLVNGRPVVYLVNQTSVSVTDNAGQVLLANCNGVMIDTKTLSDATVGLEAGFSQTILLDHSNCDSNYYGAYFYQTNDFGVSNSSFAGCTEGVFATLGAYMMVDNCTFSQDPFGIVLNTINSGIVKDNQMDNVEYHGIDLQQVNGIQIFRNTCVLSGTAVETMSSGYLDINNNTFNQNDYGISIGTSNHVRIANNTCSDNLVGIWLASSTDCELKDNTMVRDGIMVSGPLLENWNSHSIATSNTANGKPVYFFKNASGFAVPSNGGQVILANCNVVTISDADLTNASVGVMLGFSHYVDVNSVNCSGGYIGMTAVASDHVGVNGSDFSDEVSSGISLNQVSSYVISNNTIARDMTGLYPTSCNQGEINRNLFYANQLYGVYLSGTSTLNMIWNNTFAYNNGANDTWDASHVQAYDGWSGNNWYAPGTIHGWGNYWNDWRSPDVDMDGIVDNPYNIYGPAGSSDFYPLVNPPSKFVPIPEFGLVLLVPLVMLLVVLVRRRLR